jgi:hypothetical protein
VVFSCNIFQHKSNTLKVRVDNCYNNRQSRQSFWNTKLVGLPIVHTLGDKYFLTTVSWAEILSILGADWVGWSKRRPSKYIEYLYFPLRVFQRSSNVFSIIT